jgi:hypothetical protein
MKVCEGERCVERFVADVSQAVQMSEKLDEFDYFE